MKPNVYFMPVTDGLTPAEQAVAMAQLLEKANVAKVITAGEMAAIKLHVGEKKNNTHVKPELIRKIVDMVYAAGGQPFLTETSTLYKGERENAVKHLMHAHRHGFSIENTGAPFIMADGVAGNTEYEVAVHAELHETVKVAKEIISSDVLLVVSHPTGHVAAGLGACIKNLGMGLASRSGKMRQHSAMLPTILDSCKMCQRCLKWCPKDAIIEKDNKAFILTEKCIGCGECITVCRFDAVSFDWGAESGFMQRSMAEHAYGAVKDKAGKCFYINVMIDMTKDCDCFSVAQHKMIPDIGILASEDPVAVDMATLDLTAAAHGKTLAEMSYHHHDAEIQLQHAAKIGLGSLEYELIRL